MNKKSVVNVNNTSPTTAVPTKSEAPIVDNGITFTFKGTEGRKTRLSDVVAVVLNLCMVLISAGGAMYTLITMFKIPVSGIAFPLITTIFALAAVIIYMLPKKAFLISLGSLVAAVAGYVAIFYSSILEGFTYVRDALVYGISLSMKWPVPTLSYSINDAVKTESTLALLTVAFLLILLVGFFTVRKINFVVPAIVTFLFFEIGAAFGCVPGHIAFAFLLSGWTGLFAMSAVIKVRKFKARRKDKKKTKAKAIDYKKSFVASIGLLVATLTFATFLFSSWIIGLAGYNRPENMKELRAEVKDVVVEVIEYILGKESDGVLPEGQLYLLKERVIKDRDQLTLTAPLRAHVYLKGYVGQDYFGDRWGDFKDNSAFNELQKKIDATGYSPQELQGLLMEELKDKNSFVSESVATVTIEDIRKKRDYAYLAYIPQIPQHFTPKSDTTVSPGESDDYSYNAYISDTNFFLMNLSDLYYDKDFKDVMDSYGAYVKAQYTAVPEGMEDIKKIVDDLIKGSKYGYDAPAFSNLEIANRIRKYLADNTTLNLVIDELPQGKDFVKNFVLDTKEGYAPHYATAMAVMLRLAGVPTRYVEGYVATAEDYNRSEADLEGYYEMELTDKNSHAWIEVYEKNYGWISIEATPGYYAEDIMEELGGLIEDLPEDTLESLEPIEDTEDGNLPQENVGNGFIQDAQGNAEMPEETEVEEKEELLEAEPTALDIILDVLKLVGLFLLATLIAFLVFVSIIMIVLSSRRSYKLGELDKALKSGNRKRRINAIYRYYTGILRFEGVENTKNLPYMEFAEEICKNSNILRGEQHLRAMRLFLKYRFSNELLKDSELKCLERVMGDYQNKSLKSLSKKGRFIFKYIANLG